MYYCEECQRVFKTAQALAGHHQWKHGVGRAAGAAGVLAQQHAQQHGQQHAQQQDELLGNMLERLDELLGSVAQHAHESSCSGCQEMRQENLGQGRVAGIEEIAEIPGVKEAVAFASSTERWNEEHPDHKIDENWASVAGVRDLIENSQPKLVRITRGEESSPGDGVIRIVHGPEGEEVQRQQIAAIIAQNGKRNSA